jgi:hypothetical protein
MHLRTLMVRAGTTIALTGATLNLGASPATASPAAGSSTAAARIAGSALAFSASVQAGALPARYQFAGRVRGVAGGTVRARIVRLEHRSGSIWAVEVDWQVTTAAGSFTARTSGSFDTLADRIAVSGPIRGAVEKMELDAAGRITSLGGPSFDGVLRVAPQPGT